MSKSKLYISFWNNYLPAIIIQMKNAKSGAKEIRLNKSDFTNYGSRNVSEYFFDLEIKDKAVIDSSINGTTVAKDLKDLLFHNPTVKQLIKTNNYRINLSRDYILRIEILENN